MINPPHNIDVININVVSFFLQGVIYITICRARNPAQCTLSLCLSTYPLISSLIFLCYKILLYSLTNNWIEHRTSTPQIAGQSPRVKSCLFYRVFFSPYGKILAVPAPVAQWTEHRTSNPMVVSSTLTRGARLVSQSFFILARGYF